MARLQISNLEKTYGGGFKAVHGINLDVEDGEFMVLVGPSGCAKSTTLRMIAGLESITGGHVRIGDTVVNDLAPGKRGIAMVFQNYALYPHMQVRKNLSFGLRLRRKPKAEIEASTQEVSTILEIEELLDRLPRQLSGGQAQRVAVGRALIKKPDVFLFDEPLSNLDAKLRASMRVRITDLHRNLREEGRPATVVYVTHDQTEAMTMGDRICVMKEGHIMQVADAADNSPMIAAAIAATPPGGTVLVPAGTWTTGPIFLNSAITLHLAQGATLAATGDRDRFPILPARHPDGRMLGTWEGLPEPCYAALVTAIDCRGIAIAGSGTLDGGGDRGDWWTWPKETRAGARRARTLFLSGCEDLTLAGVTIRNSPSWTVHPVRCRLLVASGLSILNHPDSPNTDGFDPESCEDVLIEGAHISVGDDCVAIKAGKRGPGLNDHLAPTRRVTVRHCLMERGHGGVVIGSEMSGSVTDVTITACDFRRTDRGLRIKTRRGRGGEVARIALSDCTMQGVDTAFVANAFYFCDADGRSEPVQSRNPAPVDATTPHVSDISIRDVTLGDIRLAVGVFLGLPEAPVERISLGALSAGYDPTAIPAIPLMACGVPEMRHAGLCAEFADLTLTGEVSPPDLATIRGVSRC